MRGIIKIDWNWITEEDGDKVLEVQMWSLECGSTEWLDLGKSHFMTRERFWAELSKINSREWEIVVPYENVFIG